MMPATTLPATREIYLCKDYAGGMFWSSALCSTQRATIDRIVTVPRHFSWEQAVATGERQREAAAPLYGPPQDFAASPAGIVHNTSPSRPNECAALKVEIEQVDASARLAQFAPEQDRLRAQRQRARDRVAMLRC